MAEKGLELDLEPRRECRAHLVQAGKGGVLGRRGQATSVPVDLFEDGVDFQFLQEAHDNKLCSAKHLRDVFSICSLYAVLEPFVPK